MPAAGCLMTQQLHCSPSEPELDFASSLGSPRAAGRSVGQCRSGSIRKHGGPDSWDTLTLPEDLDRRRSGAMVGYDGTPQATPTGASGPHPGPFMCHSQGRTNGGDINNPLMQSNPLDCTVDGRSSAPSFLQRHASMFARASFNGHDATSRAWLFNSGGVGGSLRHHSSLGVMGVSEALYSSAPIRASMPSWERWSSGGRSGRLSGWNILSSRQVRQ